MYILYIYKVYIVAQVGGEKAVLEQSSKFYSN